MQVRSAKKQLRSAKKAGSLRKSSRVGGQNLNVCGVEGEGRSVGGQNLNVCGVEGEERFRGGPHPNARRSRALKPGSLRSRNTGFASLTRERLD